MINNKEKKMIQRYCIYPKIAVVALIFSFVQCALIVPLEMIDDLVFQNKGFQPTGMFTALGFVIIYVIIFCFCALIGHGIFLVRKLAVVYNSYRPQKKWNKQRKMDDYELRRYFRV